MKIFNAIKQWWNKPQPSRIVPSKIQMNIQSDITTYELAKLVLPALRFVSEEQKERWYNNLPEESKRHLKKI